MVLDRFRQENTWVGDMPLAYAGRLDPMAEGKLLVLIGDECKNQKAYHGLDKEYEFEVLLGIKSDTGDVLGLVEDDTNVQNATSAELNAAARQLTGTHTFPYPVFSSKTVNGKPLFLWALEKRLDEIEIPYIDVKIYALRYGEMRAVTKQELQDAVCKKIARLPTVVEESKALGADFRRSAVLAGWSKILDSYSNNHTFQIVRFTCICSSGTYIRTLSEEFAKNMGTKGLAYSIKRTRIGRYQKVIGIRGFWLTTYR